jgi:hypothetical protein
VTDIIDIESLSVEELEQLRDAINQRLLQLRSSERRSLPELLRMLEEIKLTLQGQGKEWRSLERWQWMDGDIRFWLNPTDQELYQAGWYTIDELIGWTREIGPIMHTFEDEEEDDATTTVDGVRIRWLPDGSMEKV